MCKPNFPTSGITFPLKISFTGNALLRVELGFLKKKKKKRYEVLTSCPLGRWPDIWKADHYKNNQVPMRSLGKALIQYVLIKRGNLDTNMQSEKVIWRDKHKEDTMWRQRREVSPSWRSPAIHRKSGERPGKSSPLQLSERTKPADLKLFCYFITQP